MVAVKKITKQSITNPKVNSALRREIQIHKKLRHVNIVRLYTSLEDDNYIYLILEYVKQGNLFYIIRNRNKTS
jgi:serine/threonine protein kinase